MTLRIQRSTEDEFVVFTLAGRIQEEQLPELEVLFQSGLMERKVVLDLEEVKLVDRGAVRFLAQREAGGMKLVKCPPYIREWILRERNGK
jgi:anti-anti-sigma regulatory factor